MSGNPYLDAYEQQSSTPNAPDAYAAYRSRRLSRLRRLQEEQDRQDEAAKAQSAFGQTPTEPTPVQKRMLAAQDAYESEIKKYGVAEGPTVQEFANTRDPRMVQMQLDREAEAKKQEAEFWKAVQAGDDGAINSALDAMAPAWDKLREQKAQIEAAKQHLASLDPATHADEILRAKPVLEDAYAQLQKTEAHLTELGDRVNAGIGARTAGEMSAAAKMDTYGARFSKFSIPTLAAIGDFLGKGQRVVSAMLAIPKNLAQGQFHAKELKAFVPGYNLFSKDVQGAGAQMNAEVGNALGQYVKEAEGDFTGQNALRGLYNPLGGALVGTSRIAAQAEEGYDIAKAKVSGEDYVPEMSGAERRASWGDTLGGLGYQIVTDPLSYIPVGAASEVFGKLIKPIEPVLDAVSKRVGLKGAAKVVRALTVGGPALEDPLMAQYAANAKAAEMTAAAPFIEGAYEAQAKLEAKLAAIPPELVPELRKLSHNYIESVPDKLLQGSADEIVANREARQLARMDALQSVPAEYRSVAADYLDAVKDDNALFKAMYEKRIGRALELSDNTLEAYNARRLHPLYQQHLAIHPEERAMLRDSKLTMHRKFGEGVTTDEAEKLMREATPSYKGPIWSTNHSEIAHANYLFAADIAKRHADVGEFINVFGRKPTVEESNRAMSAVQELLTSKEGRAAMAIEKAAMAQEDVAKLGAAKSAIKSAVSEQGRAVSRLSTLADSADLAVRQGEVARGLAGDAGNVAALKSPHLREVEDALSSFHAELAGRRAGYGDGHVPAAIDSAMEKLTKTMSEVKANFFKTEGSIDALLEGNYAYQSKVIPAYRRALRDFASEVRAAAPRGYGRRAAENLASQAEAASAQLDRLLTVRSGISQGISAAARSRAKDLIEAADAAVARADFHNMNGQQQARVIKAALARKGLSAPEGMVSAVDFMNQVGVKVADNHKFYDEIVELAHTHIPVASVNEFKKMDFVDSPAAWRKILNNVTNWFSRANLVTPTSLAKDFKGQTVQFGFAAGENGWKYLDKARRIVDGAEAPGVVSNLFASGLGKPSYHTAVNPSVGKVIADFGGGLKGRVAGAIEESGLTGGALRGVGKVVGAVPGLGTVGRGIEGAGKLVGTGLRKALNARQLTEEYFRVATYLHAIEDLGKTPLEAVQHVAKWWGDFSQLSKLENKVLKGFTMYTSWQLRALKIGMHNLVDRPLRTRLFLQLAAGNVSNNDDFPGWAQRQGGTIIGKDSAGNPKFMSRGAGSYFEPWGDILQGDAMQRLRTDGFSGAVQGVAQSGLRRLVPFLQAPIEYATNYDSFSGSQIRLESGQDTRTRVTDHAPAAVLWLPESLKKFFGVRPVVRSDTGEVSYIHMDPEWNWLFQKLIPGVESQAGFVSPLADPRKNAFDFAARALGFPTYSVREQDIQSKMKTKIRQATDALRKSVGGTGVAVDDYGNVVFDKTSDLGRQMIEDNARWDSEAKQGRNPDGTPINPDGYKRFKMANKYADALRLIDLGRYLRDWKAALENPGLPDAGVPVKDATSGLRKLGKDEARRDAAAERRALRRR